MRIPTTSLLKQRAKNIQDWRCGSFRPACAPVWLSFNRAGGTLGSNAARTPHAVDEPTCRRRSWVRHDSLTNNDKTVATTMQLLMALAVSVDSSRTKF